MSQRDDLIAALKAKGLSKDEAIWAINQHAEERPSRDTPSASKIISDLGGPTEIRLKAAEYYDTARDPMPRGGSEPKAPVSGDPGAKRDVAALDTDQSGNIDPAETEAIGDIAGDIDAGPVVNDPNAGRGAALWPYAGSGESLAELTVRDRSNAGQYAEDSRFGNLRVDRQIGPRYFEQDALAPLRWSVERRADLQRLMQQMGLYGEDKVRLGVWTAQDQDVYADVLANANVEGRTWTELLASWRANGLPPDIAERLAAEKEQAPKKPTMRITNPADIAAVGRQTARTMIGRDDPAFAQSLVGEYQAAETAQQQAVISDQDAGGGGTVTEAPNLATFAEQRLEETKPVEVDSYAVLTNWNEMLRMLGAAG